MKCPKCGKELVFSEFTASCGNCGFFIGNIYNYVLSENILFEEKK